MYYTNAALSHTCYSFVQLEISSASLLVAPDYTSQGAVLHKSAMSYYLCKTVSNDYKTTANTVLA